MFLSFLFSFAAPCGVRGIISPTRDETRASRSGRGGLNHWTAATGPAYSSLYTSLYINGRDHAPHSSFLWPPSLIMRDLVPLSSIDLLTCSIFCKQPIAWSCWANCLAQPPPQTGLEHCQSILLAWA